MTTISKLLTKLQTKLRLQIGRAIITAVDDTGELQTLQLKALADEVMDLRERLQEYGFTSVPQVGAESVFVALGGSRSNTVVVAVEDRRYRLKGLSGGEVALYDDQDQVVHIKRNGLHLKGQNILLETDGVCRIDADGLELHARSYRQDDIAGYGQRRTWLGGTNWHDDTYTTGAAFDAPTEHGLDQPDIPSNHPEAI